jgi:hypothetical protein
VRRLLLASVALAAGCATFEVDAPVPGQPIAPRAGQSLVFGTLRVVDEAGEIHFPRPAVPAVAGLLEPRSAQPHLSLLGLLPGGGRSLEWQGWSVEADGSYAIWVPAGDYALLAIHPGEDDSLAAGPELYPFSVDVAGLLRVPGDGGAVYTGELTLVVRFRSFEFKDGAQLYDVVDTDAVAASPSGARQVLERRYGPLRAPPATRPWCTRDLPGLRDERNARSLGLLDAGCGSSP